MRAAGSAPGDAQLPASTPFNAAFPVSIVLRRILGSSNLAELVPSMEL